MEIDKDVAEILEQAGDGQEIILEQEGECEEGEEVEEIIEIIEEYEEVEDESALEQGETIEQIEKEIQEGLQEQQILQKTNGQYKQEEVLKEEVVAPKQVIYASSRPNLTQKQTKAVSQVVHYDASADWEDDYEQEEQNQVENTENQSLRNDDYTYATYNNGENSEVVSADDERTQSSYTQVHYEQSVSQDNSMGLEDSQHEIVQNAENNLIYTVLGTKKQGKSSQENKSNVEYVEVERYRNDNLPDDGTVYYAVNEDGTYVQAIEGDQEYQYISEEPMEQENEEWESANQNEEIQQEINEENQIFLHEDENGDLYFKNDQGELQRVYVTPDGNYAIAENSSDDQDSQDVQQMQEEQMDSDNYAVISNVGKSYNSKKQRMSELSQDDDDSTVTISLIISEDENGQKRTQVIIPTPSEQKCNICNKSFKTSQQLLKHNRLKHAREEDITTRNFPCDLCDKRFSDQNSLARHRRTHNEGRLFQCIECHESFPTASTLRKHLAAHNPDSLPLPCIYCGRRFQDKMSLMKHEQSHLAGEKKSLVCDLCQKGFSNINDLNAHRKNHDPDRKFDCEVCGREFNRLNNLQRHMMVHQQQGENEEVLSCNICGITYKFSSSLTRHMVTTHMNPERLRQQAEEQRRKREVNYKRYLENRRIYETQGPKRPYRRSTGRHTDDQDDDVD